MLSSQSRKSVLIRSNLYAKLLLVLFMAVASFCNALDVSVGGADTAETLTANDSDNNGFQISGTPSSGSKHTITFNTDSGVIGATASTATVYTTGSYVGTEDCALEINVTGSSNYLVGESGNPGQDAIAFQSGSFSGTNIVINNSGGISGGAAFGGAGGSAIHFTPSGATMSVKSIEINNTGAILAGDSADTAGTAAINIDSVIAESIDITNSGSIVGGKTAVAMAAGSGILLNDVSGDGTITITNNSGGAITGKDSVVASGAGGDGITFTGSTARTGIANIVNNSGGTISGGVGLAAVGGYGINIAQEGTYNITNSGSIQGGLGTTYAAAIYVGVDNAVVNIDNDGSIGVVNQSNGVVLGDYDGARVRIQGSNTTLEIKSNLTAGKSANLDIGYDSSGNTAADGTVASFTGSAGNETVTISSTGTVSGTLALGSGTDTVRSAGTVHQISSSGTTNIYITGGTVNQVVGSTGGTTTLVVAGNDSGSSTGSGYVTTYTGSVNDDTLVINTSSSSTNMSVDFGTNAGGTDSLNLIQGTVNTVTTGTSGATVTVGSGGTISTTTIEASTATTTINNSGTMTDITATGGSSSTININLTGGSIETLTANTSNGNTCNISATSGSSTITRIVDAATDDVDVSVSSGATLTVGDGSSGASGINDLVVSGGTLNLAGSNAVTINALSNSSGTINFNSTGGNTINSFTGDVTSTFNINQDTTFTDVSGLDDSDDTYILNIASGITLTTDGAAFNSYGTINLYGNLTHSNASSFTNSGTINVDSTSSTITTTNQSFINNGTININLGDTGSTYLTINTGTGDIDFDGTGTGTISVTASSSSIGDHAVLLAQTTTGTVTTVDPTITDNSHIMDYTAAWVATGSGNSTQLIITATAGMEKIVEAAEEVGTGTGIAVPIREIIDQDDSPLADALIAAGNKQELAQCIKELDDKQSACVSNQVALQSAQAANVATTRGLASLRYGGSGSAFASNSVNGAGFTGTCGYYVAEGYYISPEKLSEDYEELEKASTKKTSGKFKRWTGFMNVTGGFGEQGTVDNNTGYNFGNVGFMCGVKYNISEELGVGGIFGYSYNQAFINDSLGSVFDNTLRIGPFATYQWERLYTDLCPSFGIHMLETKRNVQFMDTTCTGDRTSYDFNMLWNVGGRFDLPWHDLILTPEYSLAYTYFQDSAYEETGGAYGTNLNVDSRSTSSLLQDITLKLGKLYSYSDKVSLLPEVWLGWEYEFLDTGGDVTAAFSSLPSENWTSELATINKNRGIIGLGMTGLISDHLSIYGRYDTRFWGGGYDMSFSVGAIMDF